MNNIVEIWLFRTSQGIFSFQTVHFFVLFYVTCYYGHTALVDCLDFTVLSIIAPWLVNWSNGWIIIQTAVRTEMQQGMRVLHGIDSFKVGSSMQAIQCSPQPRLHCVWIGRVPSKNNGIFPVTLFQATDIAVLSFFHAACIVNKECECGSCWSHGAPDFIYFMPLDICYKGGRPHCPQTSLFVSFSFNITSIILQKR